MSLPLFLCAGAKHCRLLHRTSLKEQLTCFVQKDRAGEGSTAKISGISQKGLELS